MTGSSAFARIRRNAHRRAAQRRLRNRRRRAAGPETGGVPSSRFSLLILSLPGLAAVAALLFTWLQVSQTGKELRIAEEGQITNRFNAAIGNLGSGSVDVRLGGIYALERIMNDSPRDQATVVSVLSAYVRRHAPLPTATTPAADISAAMNVLVRRRPEHDEGLELDLSRTDLRRWKPAHPYEERAIHLRGVVLTGSDLSDAELNGADLAEASLDDANLNRANLASAALTRAAFLGARLRDTEFSSADLSGAIFCSTGGGCADLTGTNFGSADMTRAILIGADLRKATFCSEFFVAPIESTEEPTSTVMCATLRGANLIGANLSGVDLAGADLSGADLTDADLTKVNLTGANLTGRRPHGYQARRRHAQGSTGSPALPPPVT
ncbi:pentapeptide repeat-containing protein [Streptomyces venezuelae]|uniref:Pentapeptide repeat-containing protein n=1 Tax=Streptomyces venezuelae TaxID=54571 RepID=A0A5P2D9X1_STRVZ|nr:pentapeptide repeat-containing protein [Streptomyces venezuelae]QES51954.1 pentapeptide repeat-containing protein [Streptomyces venezuelae]